MTKKPKMTLDKLAQITAKGFLEMNERFDKRFDKVDIRFDKTDKKIDDIHKDMFRSERIQMAEIDRNDRQDTQIKQLEAKICK
jgi:hypothetical protein